MSSAINRCFEARGPDQISGRMLKSTFASIDAAVTKLSTSNFYNSFVPCTICNWNTLSSHVLFACFSVSLFKTTFLGIYAKI